MSSPLRSFRRSPSPDPRGSSEVVRQGAFPGTAGSRTGNACIDRSLRRRRRDQRSPGQGREKEQRPHGDRIKVLRYYKPSLELFKAQRSSIRGDRRSLPGFPGPLVAGASALPLGAGGEEEEKEWNSSMLHHQRVHQPTDRRAADEPDVLIKVAPPIREMKRAQISIAEKGKMAKGSERDQNHENQRKYA